MRTISNFLANKLMFRTILAFALFNVNLTSNQLEQEVADLSINVELPVEINVKCVL